MNEIAEFNRLQLIERDHRRLIAWLEERCAANQDEDLRESLCSSGYHIRVLYCANDECTLRLYHDGECRW